MVSCLGGVVIVVWSSLLRTSTGRIIIIVNWRIPGVAVFSLHQVLVNGQLEYPLTGKI